MSNYTISENITLPSNGEVYEFNVVPNIKLRSMTTAEEMQRLSNTNSAYKNLCDIIDACMVENPGISSYDMIIGDYVFLLYQLRIITYGSEYKTGSVCPFCGSTVVDTFNLDDLIVNKFDEKVLALKEFDLPVCGSHVEIKFQTPRIVDRINQQIKDFRSKAQTITYDPTILFTMKNLIEKIDGKKPNPLTVEDWIKNLSMKDTNLILQYCDKLNNSIGVETKLYTTCNICGLDYESSLRITQEFFRPALDIWW